eukprot:scaffold84351_cov19-Tisochrysis_lutea.AAC.2
MFISSPTLCTRPSKQRNRPCKGSHLQSYKTKQAVKIKQVVSLSQSPCKWSSCPELQNQALQVLTLSQAKSKNIFKEVERSKLPGNVPNTAWRRLLADIKVCNANHYQGCTDTDSYPALTKQVFNHAACRLAATLFASLCWPSQQIQLAQCCAGCPVFGRPVAH